MPRVAEWTEAPQMSTGSPRPQLNVDESSLYVAYITEMNDDDNSVPEFEEWAVVSFNALQHTFGYPNDEALGGHPLYKYGIKYYAFNVVAESPTIAELANRNGKIFPGSFDRYSSMSHWIVTFHDETLEVIGSSIQFHGVVEARTGAKAIAHYKNST